MVIFSDSHRLSELHVVQLELVEEALVRLVVFFVFFHARPHSLLDVAIYD